MAGKGVQVPPWLAGKGKGEGKDSQQSWQDGTSASTGDWSAPPAPIDGAWQQGGAAMSSTNGTEAGGWQQGAVADGGWQQLGAATNGSWQQESWSGGAGGSWNED